MAKPAMVIASMTAYGSPSSRTRSLNVPGSDSSALHTTYLGVAGWAATAAHLRPVGKAAPPRPMSLDAVTSAMTASGPISSARRSAAISP